jgi:hypothetical protein
MKKSPLSQLQVDIVKAAGRAYPNLPASVQIDFILGAVALLAADLSSRSTDPDAKVEIFAARFRDDIIRSFEADVFRTSNEVRRYPLQRLRSAPPPEKLQ